MASRSASRTVIVTISVPAGIAGSAATATFGWAATGAGADAAGKIYAGVPDGMAVPKPEPAITPATASVPEAPQPTPAAAVPNLGAAPGAAAPAGQGGQPPLTPEQQAAQRLKEQRDAERQKAMIAEAAVPNWSGSAGNTVVTGQPGGANPALAQLQAAARGLQGTPGLAQLAQAQGGGDGDDQNKQARKEAFLTKASLQPDTDYLKATVKEQISKFELKTTAVIPAVLISGINSDLPGDISAQVTDDIYDTATGRFLLIPKGTTIYGNYDYAIGRDLDDCGCAYITPHDRELGQLSVIWTLANTDQRSKDFMKGLPFDLHFSVGEHHVHLVHGSPRKVNEYLFEDKPASLYERLAGNEDDDVLVFGHTHKPWVHDFGGVRFVNCGSVGKPKDGDPRAAFAVLETHGDHVAPSIHRVAYDALAVAREMRAAGLPEELAAKLVAAA